MPYIKQTWVDNDPTRPVSAARMNVLETQAEQTLADIASRALGTGNSFVMSDSSGTLPDSVLTSASRYIRPQEAICRGFTREDVIACLNEAEALGKHSIAMFPSGTYDVGAGISLAGKSVQIRGYGAAPTGTVFYASQQSGPVLDFTGWISPPLAQHKVTHEQFQVRGSGVADESKSNAGVRLASISSVTFRDIAVKDTGGPCWEHVSVPGNGVYLSDFERLIFAPPVAAKANNVPWMVMDESNGNRFRGLGFRSERANSDVGVAGALVLTSNGKYAGREQLFDACWFEYLHVPDGGTLVSVQGNTSVHRDWQFFDCSKEQGAANTAHFRFTTPPVGNFGGNQVLGAIPGRGTGTVDIDYGVDLQQSRNVVHGTKGFRGYNVRLAPGVTNSSVDLAGAQSGATDPAWVDESGNTTNMLVDRFSGVTSRAAQEFRQGTNRVVMDQPGGVLAAGFRFFDAANPANGALGLGSSGARIIGVGPLFYLNGDTVHVRRLDNTPGTLVLGSTATTNVSWRSGTGSPEGVVIAAIGSLYSRTDGNSGSSFYVKESGTGSTGWVAK